MEPSIAQERSIDLMSQAEAVYLTTIDQDSWPVTRAMLNLRNVSLYPDIIPVFTAHNRELLLYFTTNGTSGKIFHIAQNDKASAYFCIPSEWRGLMLGGVISIVSDQKIKRMLWHKEWTMYYQKGMEDPDYIILCLQPKVAKYYEFLDSCSWNPEAEL